MRQEILGKNDQGEYPGLSLHELRDAPTERGAECRPMEIIECQPFQSFVSFVCGTRMAQG